jgi:predicted CXXCH cytochrome family protein
MVKPRKTTRKTRASIWANRRNRIIAASVAGGLVLFGLLIPMGAMQMENHDSFCASCHTEGEQTFYDRSLVKADKSTDLASFHAAKKAARCIDCHTTPGIIGRYGGLLAGATDLISFYSGHYPQPAALEEPMSDGNCLKCHADIGVKQDFNNHFHVLLPKWQAIDSNAASCVDCHSSHDTTNDAGVMFLNNKTTTDVCQKCHTIAGEG